MSVDALRGFDMFWIIGADALVYALNRMSQTRPTSFLATQLEHAEWEGFHFYDLIFPLFIFIVGVSLVYSLTRTIAEAGRAEALRRIFRRSVLLFALGIFYSGGLTNQWPDVRLMGVLNRIALAYFFAGLLFCFFRPRALVAICVAILAGYWGLMTLAPIRDIQLTKSNLARLAEAAGDGQTAALFKAERNPSAETNSPAWAAAEKMFYATTNRVSGKFDAGLNLANHIDFQYLPGRKYDVFFDPEGYLSTIPAVVTCLLGAFAGLLLRAQSLQGKQKVMWLIAFGIVSVALGWMWGVQFPVIKKIWTSSYVLVAGGYSCMLLAAFYAIVDLLQFRRWAQPFIWIGANPLVLYVTDEFLSFETQAKRIVGGDIHASLGTWGDILLYLVSVGLMLAMARFLYKRQIFLRA